MTPQKPLDGDGLDAVITQALGPYGLMPSPVEVARLTDQLLTYGQQAITAIETLPEADRAAYVNAIRDWEYLTATGPTGTTAGIANWTYTRGLARVVRHLASSLRPAATP
ncbi:hypothetical protein ADK52_25745 [Streptomyces sp. WM6372]|uniref:DUF6415 family natural product biosynthesis protein n=1 Tax=Streptomyces sp. WM6372 TaxID=1415555 RepID=UPI0006AE5EB2|nr:DUF6415 family natural product biosynthesis protein [Streptomyces sp. WM6372]KOU20985.1 hypothetical protein ADK52_25745 [Streptomyces sp. WM6372]